MKAIEFKEQNVVYAKDQPEYLPLPAYKSKDGVVVCCWELSFKERLRVLITGKLWISMLTFNKPLQPVLLETDKYAIFNR
jgi:hypothetical protein